MAEHDTAARGPGSSTADVAAQVAAHLEALNLAGMGFATRRLLGKDPRPVTNQFTMWARQDHPGLPSVTAALWEAVSPLGIGRPPGADPTLCDRVLRGRAGDGPAAIDAAAGCADAGKRAFIDAPLPQGPDGAVDPRHKALAKAVKDYWRALGTVFGELRPRVVEGDRDRAVRLLRKADGVLREVVEDVAVLATAVAAGSPARVETAAVMGGSPPAEVEDQLSSFDAGAHHDAPTGRMPASPLGDLTEAEGRAVAFARAERVVVEPTPEPRPIEVLSTKPVPNRVFAPILFGIFVAGLALFVIFSVLNGPNPLGGP